MADSISIYPLMGLNDLFPDDQVHDKQYYAAKVGRKHIQNIACHLLSFYRTGIPTNEQLFKYWLFDGSPSYTEIKNAYTRLLIRSKAKFSILSVESSLKLFTWSINANIPESIDDAEISDIDSLRLYLLFNSDLLKFFQKP